MTSPVDTDSSITLNPNFIKLETHHSNPEMLESRIKKLEDSMILVLAQVEILHEWIEKRFDVSMINKNTSITPTCLEQLHKMKQILSLLKPQQDSLSSNAERSKEFSSSDNNVESKSTRARKGKANPKRISARGIVTRDQEHEEHVVQGCPTTEEDHAKELVSIDVSNSEELQKTTTTGQKGQLKDKQWNSALPKQCDECGKILKGSSTLKLHKMMHADERPHFCEICGNRFRFKRNLKVHMMAIHTGERPLQCSYCGRKFYAPKDLKIHERTHTGEKPHACHICPKKFNVKEHLTMHIRVHTGEKPYKCDICDKTFSQANSLRIHKKIHLRDEPNGGRSKRRVPPSNDKNKNEGKGDSSRLKRNAEESISSSTPSSASSQSQSHAMTSNPSQAFSSASKLQGTSASPSPSTYIENPVGYPNSSSNHWSSGPGRNDSSVPTPTEGHFYAASASSIPQWRMPMALPLPKGTHNFPSTYYPPQ